MIKRVFVSYSYSNRDKYKDVHKILKEYLHSKGVSVYAFVFDFTDTLSDFKMMQSALNEIDKSDMILVELTNKSVGVGVEAGYAKAKDKVVIYLHRKDSELQQTVNGIADYVIPYSTGDDIVTWFEHNQTLSGAIE